MVHSIVWRCQLVLALGLLVWIGGVEVGDATAQELSGTIHYTGSHGPVSPSRPIRIFLFADPEPDEDLDEATVTTDGGSFQLRAPTAGTYYLGYVLDLDRDGDASVGEPAEIYNNRLSSPGDPIAVPQSGVSLDLGDTLVSGITGSVTYIGEQGNVGYGKNLIVQAFAESNLTDLVDDSDVESNGGRFQIFTFDNDLRYLRAFFDLNGNREFDDGEPFEIYNGRATPPGDSVVGSTDPSDIDFVFGDQPSSQRLMGTVTYTGSRGPVSPTRPIVMFMFNQPYAEDNAVDAAIIGSNGGAFALGASTAGNYYLAYVLDLNGDYEPNVGEPAVIYNGRAGFPGNPIAVPQSGVNLSFGDAIVIRGISGWVEYRGSQGQVSSERPIIVQAFSDPLLQSKVEDEEVETEGGRFDILTLDTGTYYLRAFFDANGNRYFDPGEPCEAYNNKSCGQEADPVVAGGSQTAVGIVFGDLPPAAHLSGTISYSGSLGPVSNDRPIVLFFLDKDGEEDATTVGTNGGAFDLAASSPGSQPLAYFLDVNNDGRPSPGEPIEAYNNRFEEPFDTIVVPQAGVHLDFDDTKILSGIAGTATYTGSQGPVSVFRNIVIEMFSDPQLTGEVDDVTEVDANGGRYELVKLDTGTYYLRAFLDLNQNEQLDPGEPFEIYEDKGAVPADPVIAGPAQTGIDFIFGDENAVSACVGDCNGNRLVTVEELVRGVNIALGLAPLTECTQFDPNDSQSVTVDELVKGVNGALQGCQ